MTLPEWFDLDRRLARLQERPVLLQFSSVDFRPSLHESTLRYWQAAAQAVDRAQGKGGCVLLIVRVKARPIVLAARLDEHADDDSENRESSGTRVRHIV